MALHIALVIAFIGGVVNGLALMAGYLSYKFSKHISLMSENVNKKVSGKSCTAAKTQIHANNGINNGA